MTTTKTATPTPFETLDRRLIEAGARRLWDEFPEHYNFSLHLYSANGNVVMLQHWGWGGVKLFLPHLGNDLESAASAALGHLELSSKAD